MAEQAGYNLDVYFIGEQLTGKGVPQSVDADMGYPGPFQNTIVRPVEISRIYRLPFGVREYSGKAIVYFLQFSQRLKRHLIERDGALPGGGFGTAFHKAIVRLTLAGVSILDIFQRTLHL